MRIFCYNSCLNFKFPFIMAEIALFKIITIMKQSESVSILSIFGFREQFRSSRFLIYYEYNNHIRDKKLVLGERKTRYDAKPINR